MAYFKNKKALENQCFQGLFEEIKNAEKGT